MIHFKPFNEPFEFLFLNKPHGKSITFKPGETIKAEVIDILPNGAIIAKIKDTVAQLKTEIPLQKDTTLLLKVMDSANSDKKLKLQILKQFKPSKNISETIKNLNFKENKELLLKIAESNQNKSEILKTLIDNGLLKETDAITHKIKNLITSLKNQENIYFEKIGVLFKDIKEINPKHIEEMIKNSGIFYESKAKKREKRIELKNDLKSILFELESNAKDKKIKEDASSLINQIESFQLLSKMIDGIYTFLPILWDSLDEGKIAVKRGEKESYLCKISLNFKDLGLVDTTIFLHKNDIKIDFYVENSRLKNEMSKNIDFLKKELFDDGFENLFINFSLQKDDKMLEKVANFKSLVDVKV